MTFKTAAALSLLAVASIQSVAGHGAITNVQGANGVQGAAFGIDPNTPRDGSRNRPFQQDTTVFSRRNMRQSACAATEAGDVNNIAAEMAAAAAAGMPTIAADGSVQMTLHQVNGDGAGPYTCAVSADGTGQTFTPMVVSTNVPGDDSRSDARATPFPLVAEMPAGTTCTGGPEGNACLVRCMNDARAGPFGGCIAVAREPATAAQEPAAAAGEAVAGDTTDAQGAAAPTTATVTAANANAASGAAQVVPASSAAAATGAASGAVGTTAAADDLTPVSVTPQAGAPAAGQRGAGRPGAANRKYAFGKRLTQEEIEDIDIASALDDNADEIDEIDYDV